MARKEKNINTKRINSLIQDVNAKMGNIYKDTYGATPNNSQELDLIAQDMQDNIKSIINRNGSSDIGNITKLYTRMKIKSYDGDTQLMNGVQDLFSDKSITDTLLSQYTENKYIRDLDNEIDSICKYMPKLDEALSAKKDAVLSSDNFSKTFLEGFCVGMNDDEKATFSSRFENIKEKYKLEEICEEFYDNTQKYGEQFIYVVPYNKAISDLLKQKQKIGKVDRGGVFESTVLENNTLFDLDGKKTDIPKEYLNNNGQIENAGNLKLSIDTRGFLESAISGYDTAKKALMTTRNMSIYENYIQEATSKFDRTINDDLELPKDSNPLSNDGMIDEYKKTEKIKIPGCIVKKLERENIIPLYVEEICIGYYYVEFTKGDGFDMYHNMMDSYNTLAFNTPMSRTLSTETYGQNKENVIAYISNFLSQKIDGAFVNANQDISQEIYAILKHNDIFNSKAEDSIKITFLPPEDVIHMVFNRDPKTHRGKSDLFKAMIPAKLYSCLYITNTIGSLTRGQDKRVYYVKQNIDTNISQTLLNVITQIKKSNFGIRQIENMNNILNITGRFNDYIIPVGASGDAPVQFEVMPGQEINPNTELMDKLEEMSVNSTDVPLDLIQARLSMDFATQLTMTNLKFLRSVFKRQSKTELFFSMLFTKIYNSEYEENADIKCQLPTPIFLNMTNMNNILENARTFSQTMADMEYDSDTSEENVAKKALFTKHMLKSRLGTYIRPEEIKNAKIAAEFEYQLELKPKIAAQQNQ